MEYIIENILSHEMAHANDWVSDMELSNEERLDLLLAVGSRLDAVPRYGSNYVEAIENKNKKTERYFKAQEYWAEISAQYFRDPDELDAKDYLLVDGVVRKTDPNFNCRKSSRERKELIKKYVERAPRQKGNQYAARNLPRR